MGKGKEKKWELTAGGRPYQESASNMTAGPHGPILLQDFIRAEKKAHASRERIPKRVVYAKDTGAYGTFKVTNDITQYTRAKLFSKVGNACKVLLRFSTVSGEKGSADAERDPRGFALKFYTDEGNWDLVGDNTPVFFIRDPKKFGDFIHTQKRDPHTNLKSPAMMWDFWSLNPESLHQVLILMSDRGTPFSYRHMHGFGNHTFSMINKDNELVWVKFHFKTQQGIKNFTGPEADMMKAKDPDQAQRDLVDAIDRGDYPRWNMKIQVMTREQAMQFKFNPFDLTKIWPQGEFPLMDVGVLELNEVPANYVAEVEQPAFAPAHVIDGISHSPDKMLQGRLLSYPDAHRYRLSGNNEQVPVDKYPFVAPRYQRDGAMRIDGNGPNYLPNNFDDIDADQSYKETGLQPVPTVADWYDRNAPGEDDHYTQPAWLYKRVMNDAERASLVRNIVRSMKGIAGPKRDLIINRQLCHFFRVDSTLGLRVARGLGIQIDAAIANIVVV